MYAWPKIYLDFYYIYPPTTKALMGRILTECSNCSQRFEAHYPYCPYCGQQTEDKLTLGILFNNTVSNYFSVDARFFKSYLPLMFKPGFLAKEFVDGKRIKYLHPAQMYLFISVVFFFLFSFISREQTQNVDKFIKKDMVFSTKEKDSIKEAEKDSIVLRSFQTIKENQKQMGLNDEDLKSLDSVVNNKNGHNNAIFGVGFNQRVVDSLIEAGAEDTVIYKTMGMKTSDGYVKKRFYQQMLKFLKNKSGGSVLQTFYDSVPIAMFILLPIFAFILKIFYFKKGPFAYHLVFSFYFFSFLFMVFSMLVLASLLWVDFPGWIIAIVMFSTFFYLFFGVKRFYQQGYFLSFIKSNVISFLFLSMVIPFAAVIMGVMAFLFY